MPPKTRSQKKKEVKGALVPGGDKDGSVIVDPKHTETGSRDSREDGGRQGSRRHQSEDSVKSDKTPTTSKSRSSNPAVDDADQIAVLEKKLAEMKSKRDLELLEECLKEDSLNEEIDQLHVDRLKLSDEDPAHQEMGEKLSKLRKELKALGNENRKKEIMYEREYSLLTADLNCLKIKLKQLNQEESSGSGISSVSSSKKHRATKNWVESQRARQEREDMKIAKKLQKELDEEAKEIEFLKEKHEKKKKKLRSIYAESEGSEARYVFKPPSTAAAEDLASDSNRMLAAMFARQSSGKDLPYFSGSPEQWIRFKNQFFRTTQQCQFTHEDNLIRLEKCLKGEALAAVKNLMFTEKNVPAIMKKLEKIFGNPEIIIDQLLAEVERLPIVKEGRPDALVEFGTAVINLTASLQSLERSEHLSNTLLVKTLQEKLPYQEKLRWTKHSRHMGRDLLSFSDWIEEEVEDARLLCTVKSAERRDKKEFEPRNKFQKNSGRCLAVSDNSEKSEKFQFKKPFKKGSRPCFLCGKEGHWTNQCRTLLDKKPEDRFQLVIDKRLCTSCLVPGHKIKECKRKKICGVKGCIREHHQLLHKDFPETSKKPEGEEKEVKEEINSLNSGGDTHMGALPVILTGPDGDVKCLAFIDSGSTVTLVKEEIAERLGLKGPRQPFCLKTFHNELKYGDSQVTSLGIRGAWKKSKTFGIDRVRTVVEMPIGKLSQNPAELIGKYPYLQQISLATFENEEPGILIGMREIHLFDTIRSVGDDPEAPRAMQCRLGWRLGGCTGRKGVVDNYHNCNTLSEEASLTELVKRSFTTEDFGVKVSPTLMSKADELCKEIMERTTRRVPGTDRYETGLLWRDPNVVLPDSREMALHRLYCQEKKMDRDPAFAKAYCGKIVENYEKGFYRKLTPEEAARTTPRTWFLPHFGVWNPNKPGKLRLVMDFRAKVRGVSLNDVLMKGPDFNNSLLANLWRFRQYKFAYLGDIRDMYHRVYLKEDEWDSQQFYWRGMRRDVPPDVYQMIVLTFGSTCSPSSAQFVKNKNADEHAKEYPEASKAIKRETYVDDGIGSKPTLESAKKTVEGIVYVNSKAGFETRNWNANDPRILEGLDEDLKCAEIKEIGNREEGAADRVLGLWWMSQEDLFIFRLKMHKVPREILEKKRRPTKRDVLRVTMSIYDPIGFAAHLSIKPKILIQALWTKGIGWDDEIPDELYSRWNAWLDELQELSQVQIPRCYSEFIPIAENVGLHVFCDASEKAFASIAFLRVKSVFGVEVNIVGSKTRVAPLKVLSIPRLELQAAVMGVRLGCAINEQLDIEIHSTTYWTDSMTVLKWIRSEARAYKPFVAHRIGEILDSTTVAQWRHVPTKENVADDATRNMEPCDLSPTSRWFTGPLFLKEDEARWPKEDVKCGVNDDHSDLERKAVVLVLREEKPIIDFRRFSCFVRIQRVMAAVLRIVTGNIRKLKEEFSVEELKKAEMNLVKLSQKESFAEELQSLNGGKPEVSAKSRIYKLEPFLDEQGILRVRGRLGKSREDVDFRQPAILDGEHHFTKLVLQFYHEQCAHQGQRTVAYLIRQKYWITGGMSAIKSTFHKCLSCKRNKSKICETRMSDLPVCRIQMKRPFHNTGMDYFGPMTIKIGRRPEKRWGVIFTCLATRAVHLEVAHSLSTDSAIIAVTGLSSRRGRPQNIYSDNGTNFHGAQNELKKALEELDPQQMTRRLALREIQWYFNPPAAPHMGGSWERLVGSTKRTMEGILKEQHPTDETLKGVFYEVENILNSRPLLEVPVDPADPDPITPNHILLGWQGGTENSEVTVPVWGNFEDRDLWSRKSWRVAQRLADQFWSRWQKEYLPTLNKRPKWVKTKEPVKVDDVVLVVDDAAPRNSWPLGRIVATFPGKDGEIRMVDVRTASGIYRRPTAKLVMLRTEDEASSSGGRMWGRQEVQQKEENPKEETQPQIP